MFTARSAHKTRLRTAHHIHNIQIPIYSSRLCHPSPQRCADGFFLSFHPTSGRARRPSPPLQRVAPGSTAEGRQAFHGREKRPLQQDPPEVVASSSAWQATFSYPVNARQATRAQSALLRPQSVRNGGLERPFRGVLAGKPSEKRLDTRPRHRLSTLYRRGRGRLASCHYGRRSGTPARSEACPHGESPRSLVRRMRRTANALRGDL